MEPSDRISGNRLKLKNGRFPLYIRKHFFIVRLTEHWHVLPRKVVVSSPLVTFKSCPGIILGNQL